MSATRLVAASLCAALLCAGCGSGSPGRDTSSSSAQSSAQVVKRINAAIMGDPPTMRDAANTGGSGGGVAGSETMEELVLVGLGTTDNRGRLHPRLAQDVPTLENGLWVVHPDGRMETTWKLQPGAVWHDTTPVTAEDFVFTARVGMDPEILTFRDVIYESIERVNATDSRTVTVSWKRPFIDANAAFNSSTPAAPLPHHILGRPYEEDKANFAQLSYWSEGFVGTGPYRLKEFSRSSHVVLVANDHYVTGRPKVDEIQIRFVPDSNVLLATLLAGTIDMTLGRGLSLDQAFQIREDWKEGRVEATPYNWVAVYPQLLTPSPSIVGDPRFRRALMHSLDRQQMVDGLQHGLGSIAHAIALPELPEYQAVERSIIRYEYDPRKARAMIEELGYATGADGFLRDATQQKLEVELRHISFDIDTKTGLAVADSFQRAGVSSEMVPITPQRSRDREWRATFSSFEVLGNPGNLKSLARLRLAQAPLPENSFSGTNRTRYINQGFDALLERYFNTIPLADRVDVVSQIVHHMTDQVIWMSLFHRMDVAMLPNRVLRAAVRKAKTPPRPGTPTNGKSALTNPAPRPPQWERRG